MTSNYNENHNAFMDNYTDSNIQNLDRSQINTYNSTGDYELNSLQNDMAFHSTYGDSYSTSSGTNHGVMSGTNHGVMSTTQNQYLQNDIITNTYAQSFNNSDPLLQNYSQGISGVVHMPATSQYVGSSVFSQQPNANSQHMTPFSPSSVQAPLSMQLASIPDSIQQSSNILNMTQLNQANIQASQSMQLARSPDSTSSKDPSYQDIPTLTPFAGEYGFCIAVNPNKKTTKFTPSIYSQKEDKLFVQKDNYIPFNYTISSVPSPDTYVRAMLVFTKPDKIQTAVKPCPKHNTEDQQRMDPFSNHLMICDSPHAVFEENPITGRHSIILPVEQPQPESEWITHHFRFKCLTSCLGGKKQAATSLLFTLEKNGEILGRQSVQLHICTSPGRDSGDKDTFESRIGENSRKRKGSNLMDFNPIKQSLNDNEHEEVFEVEVKGKRNYELLCEIRDAFELMRILPDEVKEKYLKSVKKGIVTNGKSKI